MNTDADDLSWADEIMQHHPLEELYVPTEEVVDTFPEAYKPATVDGPPSAWTLAKRTRMGFGKYRELTVMDVYEKDSGYLDWALEKCENLNPAIRRILEEIL